MGFKFLPAKVVQAERNTKQKLFFVSITETKPSFVMLSGTSEALLCHTIWLRAASLDKLFPINPIFERIRVDIQKKRKIMAIFFVLFAFLLSLQSECVLRKIDDSLDLPREIFINN